MGGSRKGRSGRYVRGSITIFLSMILICIASLMCGLLQSARMAGSGWYLQIALNSSLDSLMSKYHREAWENYHLFLLETNGEESLTKEFSEYLEKYLECDTVYALKPEKTEFKRLDFVTDQEGELLEEEILAYMKYKIWSEPQSETDFKDLSEWIRSADGVHAVNESYQINSEHVFSLEEILEEIQESLEKQKKLWEQGQRNLEDCHGRAFIKTAKKLSGELERMPALAEKYEKASSRLEKDLEYAEKEASRKRQEIGETAWKALSEQMASYRAYTDKEGERRKEVDYIAQLAEKNRIAVEESIVQAEETQDYIDSWEPDDEDDELDEESLWRKVLSCFSQCSIPVPKYKIGIKDKKRLRILKAISHMAKQDLLSLVLPKETAVSEREIRKADLPSGGSTGYRMETEVNGMGNLIDRALINEYIAAHFLLFQGEKQTGKDTKKLWEKGEHEQSGLLYEQEYIMNGRDSDRENLSQTVIKLISVREALNLLHILGDSEKQEEARLLASALTGAASVTPIADIVSYFIMGVWAFAESVEDVRALLREESVPLIKGKDDWKLNLDELFHFVDNQEKISSSGGKDGLGYGEYLKAFFLVQDRGQRNGRIMDVIQNNISEKQEGFQMKRCAVGIAVECTVSGAMFPIRKSADKMY